MASQLPNKIKQNTKIKTRRVIKINRVWKESIMSSIR
jgi:hypothetical protein